MFVGGLGYQGQKTTHFPEKCCCLALPPSAAKPKSHSLPENVWFLGLGTPGLQNNTWPTKTLRDPVEIPGESIFNCCLCLSAVGVGFQHCRRVVAFCSWLAWPSPSTHSRLTHSSEQLTQLYLRTLFILFLSPSPRGVRGRVRTVTSLRKLVIWGRFRPGSGG